MERKKLLSFRNRLLSILDYNLQFDYTIQNASQIISTTTCKYKINASKLRGLPYDLL